ncbi:VWA domain-containing protein [Vibrio sp. FNV 38]|nr:VWA domain-containing protein [Vibrio sp. FNV 38]
MTQFEFIWLWVLIFLPIPWLVRKFVPAVKAQGAVYIPNIPSNIQNSQPKHKVAQTLCWLIWGCLIVALARPVHYGDPIILPTEHRDMMLVVDLSYSMNQEDMRDRSGNYIDRLTAVKNVLTDFTQQRQGDRLGLVVYADHAYLQSPLTLDTHSIIEQINQMVLKLIGTQTAIGDGIGIATKMFIESDAPQRIMVLLSDGSNNSGVLDPMEAAQIAKQNDATIYTIGVGAGEMVVKDFFVSRKVNTAHDLDEELLQNIADLTGGQYFRARDNQDLEDIYQAINQLEPISLATEAWRPQTEWFTLPLCVAFILSLVLVIFRREQI